MRLSRYGGKTRGTKSTEFSTLIIEALLKSSKMFDSTHSIKELDIPEDKQNVPLAIDFVLEFIKAVSDKETVKQINFRFANVCDELQLFKFVIEGLLFLYSYIYLDMKSKLEMISKAAHLLLLLLRILLHFIPNELHHDVQATFEDSFYCS